MLASKYGRAKNVEILLDVNEKSNCEAKSRNGLRAIHYAT